MEHERRVEALEQEVEILKSQIQAVLLDIHELLLTNRYPALRAEDAPVSPAAEVVRKATPQTVTIDDPVADSSEKKDSLLIRKMTALDETQPAPAVPAVERAPFTQQIDHPNWSTLNEIEMWVNERIGQMGTARTQKLIEFYAQKGRISRPVQLMLTSLVAAYEEQHPTPARQTPTAPAAKAKKQPAKPAAKPGRAAASNNGHKPSARQPAPPPAAAPELSEAEESSLILRLIAGVHNAGAGISRRRNHG